MEYLGWAILAGVFGAVIGYIIRSHEAKDAVEGQLNKDYLWKCGWKYLDDGYVIAPDEKGARPLYEAIERQKELDRVKRLNLPTEALKLPAPKTYEAGDWIDRPF